MERKIKFICGTNKDGKEYKLFTTKIDGIEVRCAMTKKAQEKIPQDLEHGDTFTIKANFEFGVDIERASVFVWVK